MDPRMTNPFDSWQILGASVTGFSHKARNQPGQDRFLEKTWCFDDHQAVTVVVCADGAGSAARSWAGAWVACQSVMRSMHGYMISPKRRNLLISMEFQADSFFAGLFGTARRRLEQWAQRLGTTSLSLSTTLNVAILTANGALLAQLGDGLIGYQFKDFPEKWHVVENEQASEFAGETTFLTSTQWLEHLRVKALHEPLRRVVVSTDGLLPIIFHAQSSQIHSPFLDPLFEFVQKQGPVQSLKSSMLQSFLSSQRVSSRCDDDLTLILCSRLPHEVDEIRNESYS